MKRSSLIETAYHEAGHAVAAWSFGHLRKRDYVTIVPEPQHQSLGHLQCPDRIPPGELGVGSHHISGRARLQIEKEVVKLLAGNAAQTLYRKTNRRYLPGGRDDRQQAMDALAQLAGGEERVAYFKLLQIRAENLVGSCWPEVEAVAKRLLADKTLTKEQIRETCLAARGSLSRSAGATAVPFSFPTRSSTPAEGDRPEAEQEDAKR